uniref:Uncharacterized protein n=1 Tax=Rhizophora mucronata TaxID=61149 RepID=A0A2P2PIQ4_RHIMU
MQVYMNKTKLAKQTESILFYSSKKTKHSDAYRPVVGVITLLWQVRSQRPK